MFIPDCQGRRPDARNRGIASKKLRKSSARSGCGTHLHPPMLFHPYPILESGASTLLLAYFKLNFVSSLLTRQEGGFLLQLHLNSPTKRNIYPKLIVPSRACRHSKITTKGQNMSYKDDQTLRDLNKALDGLDKELREKKRQELNTRFALGAEILRKDGTKERKIQEIFKRTYETWRQARDTPPDDPEIRSGLENPEAPVRLIIEPPGVKLSEVKTQQIDWLWQRRIPLGKITILDGDPGMGKSLLAINIAACISTGRPMPDDTPGRQGSTILIAPEASAEDTLKPRMEAAGGGPSKMVLLNTTKDFDAKRLAIHP